MVNKCGCEYDEKCTLIPLCRAQDMVEDAVIVDPLAEFKDEIITFALDYVNECKFGREKTKAHANLWEAVERYENEKGDG
jgi:hypothetical protein